MFLITVYGRSPGALLLVIRCFVLFFLYLGDDSRGAIHGGVMAFGRCSEKSGGVGQETVGV